MLNQEVGKVRDKMIGRLLHAFSLLALLLTSSTVCGQGDDCPMLLERELGNTTALSATGLLATALSVQSGEAGLSYQLLEYNTVCLAQGTVKDTYRSTSLIVRYLESGGAVNTQQLHLQCVSGQWDTFNFGSSQSAVTDPGGTLSTPLRRDCFLCLDPLLAQGQGVSFEEHCLACSPGCTGLMRCFGPMPIEQMCCNYFDFTGSCVAVCPPNSTPNTTFDCECDVGYSQSPVGSVCVEDDECESGPCDNGGTCTDLLNDFSCACVAGYTGDMCETDIDDCSPNPCDNGGTCTDLVNDFSCACIADYTGVMCETDIDDCSPNPCDNGGTCTDLVNNFSCACVAGYTGDTCGTDIDDCSPNPCDNGGSCTDLVNDFSCACVAGYTGDMCEIDIDDCSPNPCDNGGTCTDLVNNFSCACVAGYTGDTCGADIDDCSPNPCDNGGTCTDLVNDFSCACVAGYTGDTCGTDIDDCSPNPCDNGGTCTDLVNDFSCACVAGYTGDMCETDIDNCSPNPCDNGGTCTDLVNDFSCACVPGYTGDMCENDIDDCSPNPCDNGGTCTDLVNDFSCACVAGYTGDTCGTDIDDCSPNPCDNGGTCTDLVNDFSCACVAGYTGVTCETDIDDCEFDPCQNGGLCTDFVDRFSCLCPSAYTGDTCEINIDDCKFDPCENGGTCMDLLDAFSCACVAGYTGSTCETDIDDCSPDPCDNGGSCTDLVNNFSCLCVAGYTGDTCGTDIDDCSPNPCDNGGTCTDLVNDFSCACVAGYTGDNCERGCTCDSVGAVSNNCDGVTGECPCKPGVGGVLCDVCLQNYTDFGPQGCREVGSCDCDPIGALSEECDSEGVCQCHVRVTGDQCDMCAFGYRDLTRGCTPCPACFDEVALLFNETLELYRQLLIRLNSTLEGVAQGGADSALLSRVEEYRRRLEELLERATNASMSEERLTSEHAALELTASSLQNVIEQFLANLTNAESAFIGLEDRLNSSRAMYDNLQMGVANLERVIRQELRQLLQEAQQLNQEILTQLAQLQGVVTDASLTSSELLSQAETLVEQVTLTLENASLALLTLQRAIELQNQTQATVEVIESSLVPLEQLMEVVREALDNATIEVPNAFSEASRVLEAVLNISLDGLDFESRREEVIRLEEDVSNVGALINESNSLLDTIQANFSILNTSSLEILTQSRELNNEARVLLNRSRTALLIANESVLEGNVIITEASELLSELQFRFLNVRNLTQGLDDVIQYVVDAEMMSLMAEGDAERAAAQIEQVDADVSTAVRLLEEVSEMLTETLMLANEVNIRADQILSDASSLNSSAADLADEVRGAESEADQLEQAVADDRDAIAEVTCTANDTIILAEDILQRISVVNATLANLTLELEQTQLLLPERLQEATATLAFLEDLTAQNQILVDSLTAEIERLQRSASELRERYTMLRQHRDLLQEILGNVEELNCREQFEV